MAKLIVFLYSSIFNRNNSPLIIGLCIGIALSLVQTPFLQSDCSKNGLVSSNNGKLSNIRDLRSNQELEELKDVEPTIHLDQNVEVNRKGKEKQINNLIRPRYYSTELGMRDKVLVSVISSKETISSNGVAINKTLNGLVDKLIFFLDGTGTQKFGLNIPIVGFKDSKPLIKIFRILSYLNEKYLNDYDYFMIVSDLTYVNGKRLMTMLQEISINQNVHMGVPIEKEDSFYCSLDNGIVLSQSVMEAIGKELVWCVKNSFSELDTDNLGRCILHSSNLMCKASYQTEYFASNDLKNENEVGLQANLDVSLKSDNVVTVANVHKANDIYRLHVYYLQGFVSKTKEEISQLRNKIEATMAASPINVSLPWPIGSPPPHVPPTRHDIINWETFNGTHLFMPSDFENIKAFNGLDLMDIMGVVNAGVSHINTKSSIPLQFENIIFGHRRYDPTRGMDYLISLNVRDNNGNIINKRIEGYRGLTQPEIIPMPYVTENTRVTIVSFIEKHEVSEALNFLNLLSARAKLEQLTIVFSLLYDEGEKYLARDDPFVDVKSHANEFSKKYYSKQTRASYIHLTVPQGRPSDLAILDLILHDLDGDSIILVTETKAFFDSQFLNRVRMNTIKNCQIFSPIPFILYHPEIAEDKESYDKKEVNKGNGHFDKYYFKHISFYVEDYKAVRYKFKSMPLVKTERDLLRAPSSPYEVSIYDMFTSDHKFHILRGVEPSLILSYANIDCPESIPFDMEVKKTQCRLRQGLAIGPKTVVSKVVLQHDEKKIT